MDNDLMISIGMEALKTVLLVSLPIMGLGLAAGLTVSIFQAVTQIQDMTLTFIPKIVAMVVGLFLFSHWMMNHLLVFTRTMIQMIPQLIR